MKKQKNTSRLTAFLFSLVMVLACSASAFAGVNVIVLNNDGPGEGFNDPTPAAPVGGNPGTTKGAQRLYAFQYAADIWGATLDSNVDIYVVAAFNPLAPNVLGSAGAWDVFSDFPGVNPAFPGAEFPGTWYSSALADKRAGVDQDETAPDISAQFSSNFNFYLGVDNNHGALNDLVAVLLHELGHGVGFQNFVNEANGAELGNFFDGDRFYPVQPDIFERHTLDTTTGQYWHQMTQAQRAASAVRYGRVVWDGTNVSAGVPTVLSFGSTEFRINIPASLAGAYQSGLAQFGPPLNTVFATNSIVAAVDAANPTGPTTTDGCTPFTNAAAVSGKFALIERGTCGFTVKVKNAQDAGALGAIIYNNAANAAVAPTNMATDPVIGPTITIPSVNIIRADGLAILAQPGGSVSANLGKNMGIRAGTDIPGMVRLYMPFPVAGGSSGSHYDTIASRNLLMEPAINPDLTHNVKAPEDLTLELLRDIGWFPDADVDGRADDVDNCPLVSNGNQADNDGDAIGDACDTDDDNDGVLDVNDNCQFTANSNQANNDGDALGDVCDADDDNDGVVDASDNCPFTANSGQANNDGDAQGDVCDADDDNDGILDVNDNCQFTANPGQEDFDLDGIGDVCDSATGPVTNKDQCKNNGWMRFDVPRTFKNQGDCIQWFNTGK
ncbi:MAG: hypothetical protein QOH25_934 [Acidobacteriota bacterium]|jgi:hypothetical protein|nr:hypothetical protein [Acidobacteriota bacterium]